MKKCSRCKQHKALCKFAKDSSKRNGLRSDCKECHNESRKEYYLVNKDKINEKSRVKQSKNREKYNKQKRDWNNKNPSKYLLTKARARAKKLCIPFNITEEDIVIPKYCPALNIEISKQDGGFANNSATLDRIIPGLGYIKGNVKVISGRANRIKNDATQEELEKILIWLRSEKQ